MLHLGDITKISGYTAPIVDCIIGGSPCQDLSVAGKRAGLDGERSGLYIEQVRIVKEMRERDRNMGRSGVDIRPRYMVWENVPGAFSSNKGEDFRIVLEELAKVADQDAVIPRPADGKWRTSGCILGDGWSIAWRVSDAQFWGVPQRRRRIALVADFGGHSAPEILFVRKSLSGHSDESKPKGQATPTDATRCFGEDDRTSINYEKTFAFCANAGAKANGIDRAATAGCNGKGWREGKSYTLDTIDRPAVVYAVDQGGGKSSCHVKDGQAPALTTTHDGSHAVNYQKTVGSLCARDYKGVGSQYVKEGKLIIVKGPSAVCCAIGNGQADQTGLHDIPGALNCMHDQQAVLIFNKFRYIVRRLTPLECERLQGYPDGWTDIGEWMDSNGKVRKTSDAARYKALGNSIALPPWKWVLKRLCACYERDATMASLFDGIGGFPYLWEQLNGKGSCLWASEIEEFPIAVTKVRIG